MYIPFASPLTIGFRGFVLAVCVAAVVVCGDAWARQQPTTHRTSASGQIGLLPQTFAFQHDNDVIFASDRDYSSGLFLRLGNVGKLGDAARGLAKLWLPESLQRRSRASFGLSLGQEIYTPLDTLLHDFLPGERPYAGWLFVGLHHRVVTPRWGLRVALRLGIVGRWSFAQDVQQLWHAFVRSFNPTTAEGAGWDYQLPHEFTVQLIATWEWYLFRLRHNRVQWMSLDVIAEAAVGNVWVHPELRLRWAIGWLPRQPHDSLIPTVYTGRAKASDSSSGYGPGLSWHVAFYAEAFGRLVIRNLFLDGSTFGKSHRIERYPAVAGVDFGIDWRVRTFRMRFGVVVQTLDAPYALRGYQDHKFFRLTLSYQGDAK